MSEELVKYAAKSLGCDVDGILTANSTVIQRTHRDDDGVMVAEELAKIEVKLTPGGTIVYIDPKGGKDVISSVSNADGAVSADSVTAELADKSVKELQKMAKRLGLTGFSKLNKKALISAVAADLLADES